MEKSQNQPLSDRQPSVVALVNSITSAGITGTSLNTKRMEISMRMTGTGVVVTHKDKDFFVPFSNVKWIEF